MTLRRQIFTFVVFCFLVGSACSSQDRANSVPSDFVFVMDVSGVEDDLAGALHLNMRINAKGRGYVEYYDSEGTIRYDLNGMVIYDRDQIVKTEKFRLTDEELGQLWDVLNKNHFFELEEAYQAAIGHSYAFIMVEANGRQHQVDNIGVEVPEIRAIVESTEKIVPEDINFEYGEGFKP
jgi:hypothetical protein